MYAATTVLLFVLALPPFSLSALACLMFVPLWCALDGKRSTAGHGMWQAGAVGAALGSYVYWGAYGEGWGLYGLCIGLCALMFALCGRATANLLARGPNAVLLCPLLWAAAEQCFNRVGLPFEFAITLDNALPVLQLASVGGPWWVTILIVLVNTLMFLLIRTLRARQWSGAMAWALVGGACVAGVHGWGAQRMQRFDSAGDLLHVAVAQTSLPPQLLRNHAEPGRLETVLAQHQTLQRELDRWATPQRAEPRLTVIWPESAVPGIRLAVANDLLAAKKNADHLVHSYATTTGFGLVSESVLWGEGGRPVSYSRKSRPVPIAERNLAAGSRQILHRGAGAPFGALICYEAAFPEQARQLLHKGAAWLAVSSNDAYEWPSFLHQMNFALTRIRAIENGVPVARAANGGVSAIISPAGVTMATVPPFDVAVARARIPLITQTSWYARHGDWMDIGLLLAALPLAGWAVMRPHSERSHRCREPGRRIARRCLVAALPVLGVALAINTWQYRYMTPFYFDQTGVPEQSRAGISAPTTRLDAALEHVLRAYAFASPRHPYPGETSRLAKFASAHGLQVHVGSLTDSTAALEYSMTGLIKLAAGDIAVLVARQGRHYRVFFPQRRHYRWIAISRLSRMQIGPVVWLMPAGKGIVAA